MNDVTLLLQATSRRDDKAQEALFERVYAELRRMAAGRMASEAAGQTLQPTALVHEAWLQLVGAGERSWQNRAHFFWRRRMKARHVIAFGFRFNAFT